jgi:TRAP-type uncharacterized transport system fused permease subunit
VYFSAISAITPPVAVAAYAAGAISEDNPMKTGVHAFRYAIPGFIIPYVMVYDQGILLQGSWMNTLGAIISCLAGVMALCSTTSGWLFTRTSYLEKGCLFSGGILLIFPEPISSFIGVIFILPAIYLNYRRKQKTVETVISISENG